MNLVFRTDASLDIGTGHVMRCLTMAEALRQRGANSRFVCRAHPGNLLDMIRQRGFAVDALPAPQPSSQPLESLQGSTEDRATSHPAWLGADWFTDAHQTQEVLRKTPVDWLIVDHYALDFRWERQLRPACRSLMVVDDLADRMHECDLLLDHNIGRATNHYTGKVPSNCIILTGSKYALLRPEFAELRAHTFGRRATSSVKRLLICMGGIDQNNATSRVLDALKQCDLPSDCRISVAMGPHAVWLPEVLQKASQARWPTEVLVGVTEMAALISESDLAIGAAGVSALERCCLGLPSLIMVLADNQRRGAKQLEENGAALLLSDGDRLPADLDEKLTYSLTPRNLQSMQQACLSITDGSGMARLISFFTNP